MQYNTLDRGAVTKSLATGAFKPHLYLTNVSTAFFQDPSMSVHDKVFPRVPVQLSVGNYYIFSREDLARDNMQRKPEFGKVTPAVMGLETGMYECAVDQIIVGIDQIQSLNYERMRAPGAADPRKAKVRFATEQANLHLDLMFSKNFFKSGIWTNEYSGVSATPSGKQFYQFDNANSDPIKLVHSLKYEMLRSGRRMPNKIALGAETFAALIEHPAIIERVKSGGSTANPAVANEKVLAELFGVEQVTQLLSTYNSADFGEEENMQFVCDPKGMLLTYSPNAPAIDEPSAGYTFTWDMLGGGHPMVFSQWLGENGTHTEFIEGLCGYDMKKTCDELGIYLKDCVA